MLVERQAQGSGQSRAHLINLGLYIKPGCANGDNEKPSCGRGLAATNPFVKSATNMYKEVSTRYLSF